MRLAEAFVEILHDEGVDRVFGNPGTTELPLVDALVADGGLPYVLGTHEGPVVAMADGYARATGRPAFVSLHVASGTANGLIGMLNALRSRTPLVIVAGQQDSRHLIQDPMLAGDLVGLAQAATKWAVEARRADEVPALLRRAFRAAVTPPGGRSSSRCRWTCTTSRCRAASPPALCWSRLPRSRTSVVPSRCCGPAGPRGGGRGRRRPVRGGRRGGPGGRLARRGGLPRTHERPARLPDDPRGLPRHAAAGERADPAGAGPADVVLLAGVRAFVPHHYTDGGGRTGHHSGPGRRRRRPDRPDLPGGRRPARRRPRGARSPRRRAGGLGEHAPPTPRPATRPAYRTTTRCRCTRASPRRPSPGTCRPARSWSRRRSRRDCWSGSTSASRTGLVPPHRRRRSGLGRGRGGRGLAGRPERRVVALLGDGCTLFGVQALWTAAREQVPVTFVVFANGEYRTLKQTLTRMRSGRVEPFLGMDLGRAASTGPRFRVPRRARHACHRRRRAGGAGRRQAAHGGRSWSRCRPGLRRRSQ